MRRYDFSETLHLLSRPLVQHPTLVLFSFALIVRLIHLGRSPHTDELFHLLAARSLLTDGDLIIDGHIPYSRAWTFSYLMAGLFKLFGESLVVARLPGVVAGAGLVALVFRFLRSEVGLLAAWTGALLLCFDPSAIYLSQLGRFYGVHAFLFFLGAVSLYYAARNPSGASRTVGGVLGAVLAISLALSVQITTLMGVFGLLSWLALAKSPSLWRRIRVLPYARPALIALVLLAIAISVTVFESGLVANLWRMYHTADVWAEKQSGNVAFYHIHLLSRYSILWPLFPIIVVIALRNAPRVSGFCTVVFSVSVALASLGAMKHERYIYYVLPFFFALCGIALAVALPWLRSNLQALFEHWSGAIPNGRARTALVYLVLVAILLFAIGSNRAFFTTAEMLAVNNADNDVYGWQPNWIEAANNLQPMVDESSLILSSNPLAAVYFLDRVDVSLHSRELMGPSGRLPEFTVPNWYVPRPTISKPESLALLLTCSPSGAVFVEERHWRNPWIVPDDLADYISNHLERVEVPEPWGLFVFRWRRPRQIPELDCGALPG
jgi:4-amino-4-deoxy-L-arabinose transferase-like glycosyltransferase